MNGYNIAHGLPNSIKISIAAKKANINKAEAIAVWISILDYASQSLPRGSIKGLDIEEIAINLDIDLQNVREAIKSFRDKNMLSKSNYVTNWKKNQKISSTLRTRAFRARQKAEKEKLEALERRNNKETEEEVIKRRIRLQNQMRNKYKEKGKTIVTP